MADVKVTQARDYIRYLAKLADWMAGQGFCQIDGLDDPEEWCFGLWSKHGPENGDGYSSDALADKVIEVTLRAATLEGIKIGMEAAASGWGDDAEWYSSQFTKRILEMDPASILAKWERGE